MREDRVAWEDCPVPDCKNKVCLRLNSEYCYPHTIELNGGVFHDSVNTELVNLKLGASDAK